MAHGTEMSKYVEDFFSDRDVQPNRNVSLIEMSQDLARSLPPEVIAMTKLSSEASYFSQVEMSR